MIISKDKTELPKKKKDEVVAKAQSKSRPHSDLNAVEGPC